MVNRNDKSGCFDGADLPSFEDEVDEGSAPAAGADQVEKVPAAAVAAAHAAQEGSQTNLLVSRFLCKLERTASNSSMGVTNDGKQDDSRSKRSTSSSSTTTGGARHSSSKSSKSSSKSSGKLPITASNRRTSFAGQQGLISPRDPLPENEPDFVPPARRIAWESSSSASPRDDPRRLIGNYGEEFVGDRHGRPDQGDSSSSSGELSAAEDDKKKAAQGSGVVEVEPSPQTWEEAGRAKCVAASDNYRSACSSQKQPSAINITHGGGTSNTMRSADVVASGSGDGRSSRGGGTAVASKRKSLRQARAAAVAATPPPTGRDRSPDACSGGAAAASGASSKRSKRFHTATSTFGDGPSCSGTASSSPSSSSSRVDPTIAATGFGKKTNSNGGGSGLGSARARRPPINNTNTERRRSAKTSPADNEAEDTNNPRKNIAVSSRRDKTTRHNATTRRAGDDAGAASDGQPGDSKNAAAGLGKAPSGCKLSAAAVPGRSSATTAATAGKQLAQQRLGWDTRPDDSSAKRRRGDGSNTIEEGGQIDANSAPADSAKTPNDMDTSPAAPICRPPIVDTPADIIRAADGEQQRASPADSASRVVLGPSLDTAVSPSVSPADGGAAGGAAAGAAATTDKPQLKERRQSRWDVTEGSSSDEGHRGDRESTAAAAAEGGTRSEEKRSPSTINTELDSKKPKDQMPDTRMSSGGVSASIASEIRISDRRVEAKGTEMKPNVDGDEVSNGTAADDSSGGHKERIEQVNPLRQWLRKKPSTDDDHGGAQTHDRCLPQASSSSPSGKRARRDDDKQLSSARTWASGSRNKDSNLMDTAMRRRDEELRVRRRKFRDRVIEVLEKHNGPMAYLEFIRALTFGPRLDVGMKLKEMFERGFMEGVVSFRGKEENGYALYFALQGHDMDNHSGDQTHYQGDGFRGGRGEQGGRGGAERWTFQPGRGAAAARFPQRAGPRQGPEWVDNSVGYYGPTLGRGRQHGERNSHSPEQRSSSIGGERKHPSPGGHAIRKRSLNDRCSPRNGSSRKGPLGRGGHDRDSSIRGGRAGSRSFSPNNQAGPSKRDGWGKEDFHSGGRSLSHRSKRGRSRSPCRRREGGNFASRQSTLDKSTRSRSSGLNRTVCQKRGREYRNDGDENTRGEGGDTSEKEKIDYAPHPTHSSSSEEGACDSRLKPRQGTADSANTVVVATSTKLPSQPTRESPSNVPPNKALSCKVPPEKGFKGEKGQPAEEGVRDSPLKLRQGTTDSASAVPVSTRTELPSRLTRESRSKTRPQKTHSCMMLPEKALKDEKRQPLAKLMSLSPTSEQVPGGVGLTKKKGRVAAGKMAGKKSVDKKTGRKKATAAVLSFADDMPTPEL